MGKRAGNTRPSVVVQASPPKTHPPVRMMFVARSMPWCACASSSAITAVWTRLPRTYPAPVLPATSPVNEVPVIGIHTLLYAWNSGFCDAESVSYTHLTLPTTPYV